MASLRERAAHSIDRMFFLYSVYCSLCAMYIVILVIYRFVFQGKFWVVIAPVPGHCLLATFAKMMTVNLANTVGITLR